MTKKTERNAIIRMSNRRALQSEDMDKLITKCLLDKTMGEICQDMEKSQDVRTYTAARIIVEAIEDLDIGLIGTIIKRVDGGIPKAEERESYANLVGNAIDDVLDMPKDEQEFLDFEKDSGIICLAKAIVLCAIQRVGNNVSRKRDRQIAADILLSRTGGLKTEPRKLTAEVVIEDADWAK